MSDDESQSSSPPPPAMIGDTVRLVAGILAALVFGFAGVQMMGLQFSEGVVVSGGDLTALAFYHALGLFSFGMALLSISVAIARR